MRPLEVSWRDGRPDVVIEWFQRDLIACERAGVMAQAEADGWGVNELMARCAHFLIDDGTRFEIWIEGVAQVQEGDPPHRPGPSSTPSSSQPGADSDTTP